MKMLVDEFIHGNFWLRTTIQDYIKAQAILQTVSNPSGALGSGRGLGEPKYYSNLTRFNGDWGRPQRDGPALRATALITYSRWLLSTGRKSDVTEAKEVIWPVIQNDLYYVSQYWNSTGFDLWEEVLGSSFFATAVQHRALIEGAALGKRLGIQTSPFESQTSNILCFLQAYWNGEYALSNINTQDWYNRSGIDANTVLTSIASKCLYLSVYSRTDQSIAFDPEAKCDDALFQPCSPRALASLKVYVDSFRDIYTINKDASETSPVATGRYKEDVYFEGNPWYLTTLSVAEQLYDAIQQWSTINTLTVCETSLPFWKSVYPSAKLGTYRKSQREFNKLLDAVLNYADGFVKIALKYTPSSGALAEQYSRENGTAISARDLTWSYASFITMRGARLSATSEYMQVPSWGAPSAPQIPSSCKPGSVPGVYAPALKAGAPPGSGGCTILVTFNVNASTFYGENVYLTGNTTDLGQWNPNDAVPGSANEYTAERPLWSFTVELPANSSVEYGYLRKEPDGAVLMETRNRTLEVPLCGDTIFAPNATVEDEWVGPTGTPVAKLL